MDSHHDELDLRCVAYLRVSTREQFDFGVGLDAQRAHIQREAETRSWQVVQEYVDTGISGKSMAGRPALQAAIQALRDGQASTLVAAKLDRISRSVHDFSGLMAQARREKWDIVALDLGIDMTTLSGKLIANVMASFAEHERELIGQRTADALSALRGQGIRLGRPRQLSLGVIRRIVTERQRGASLEAIARGLQTDGVATAHGGRQWWPATVAAVLRSQAAHDLGGPK